MRSDRAGLEEPQGGLVTERGCACVVAGPVLGQGRVVRRRPALHHVVPDDPGPTELQDVGAASTVAEHPSVPTGPLNMPKYLGTIQCLGLFRWVRSAHL